MMKKLFFIAMLMCMPMITKAADVVIDGIFYNLSSENKTAEVTYLNDKYNSYFGDVVIPASFTYGGTKYSVTTIGGSAFRNCTSLNSVIIPESVTTIGYAAFIGCSGLTSVLLSNNVVTIREEAFKNCSSLISFTIPKNVKWIGTDTFRGCSSLTSITIGNSVTSIGKNAFSNCYSLKNVVIPDSVTIIRDNAFTGCSSLESITFGSGLTHIADYAFSSCPKLAVVYCFAKKVPSSPYGTNSDMFYKSQIGKATLYARTSLINQYMARDPWYGFGTIEPLDCIDGVYYNFKVHPTFRVI